MKRTILVSFLVASALFVALPTAQSHEGLSGVTVYAELQTKATGAQRFAAGFDFDLLLKKTSAPDPGWLECKLKIGGADYVLRFETTRARENENYFLYRIVQLKNGKRWQKSGNLSVVDLKDNIELKLLSLTGGIPEFSLGIWASTDSASMWKNHWAYNPSDLTCRNR
jgi:hypothetical protein